jgi:hypothetical protein
MIIFFMDKKTYSPIALSILIFALIAAGIPTTFENVYGQGEDQNTGGGGITNGTSEHENTGGTTEGGGGDTEGETDGEES